MPITHVVKQGEYLSRIATEYGFSGYKVIWNHPGNAKLKSLRVSPNVLLPGDELVIPDRETKTESRPVDARHRFVALGDELKLRISVRDVNDKPVAGVKFLLSVEAADAELTADGRGLVEKPIPRTAETGTLILRELERAGDRVLQADLPVRIGHLDPVDTKSGQVARLNNLGYRAGEIAAAPSAPPGAQEDKVAALRFRSAVEEFQCDSKLKVDGVCGGATQAKLKEVHGS